MHYWGWNRFELWCVMYVTMRVMWRKDGEKCKQLEEKESEKHTFIYLCSRLIFMNLSVPLFCFCSLLMHILCCVLSYDFFSCLRGIFGFCFQSSVRLNQFVETTFNEVLLKFKCSTFYVIYCSYITVVACVCRYEVCVHECLCNWWPRLSCQSLSYREAHGNTNKCINTVENSQSITLFLSAKDLKYSFLFIILSKWKKRERASPQTATNYIFSETITTDISAQFRW